MAFRPWMKAQFETAKSNPRRAALETCHTAYLGLWHTLTSRWPVGANVFDYDWDVLVVLDACRVDASRAVESEYSFLDDISAIWAIGSHSHEWMARTFTTGYRDKIESTAYINSNGYANILFEDRVTPPTQQTPFEYSNNEVVDPDVFFLLDNTHGLLDDETYETYGTVPPRYITDRAIHVGREYDPSRVIVHYFQPHVPFIGRALREGREPEEREKEAYNAAERGEMESDELWRLYLDNLRAVLDEVAILRKNMEFNSMVITADHGDWLGEFGMYGHPEGIMHPSVRKVPWARTSVSDERTHVPASDNLNQIGKPGDGDVINRLEDLGYNM